MALNTVDEIWDALLYDYKQMFNALLMMKGEKPNLKSVLLMGFKGDIIQAAWLHYLDARLKDGFAVSVGNFLEPQNLNKYVMIARRRSSNFKPDRPKGEKAPFRYYQCDKPGCDHERTAVLLDDDTWDDQPEYIGCTRCGTGRMWRDDRFEERVGEPFWNRSLKPWLERPAAPVVSGGCPTTTPAEKTPQIDAEDVNGAYMGVLQTTTGGEIEFDEDTDFF